jgi:hypothetical protein
LNLKTRIERLEQRAGIGEPLNTIAFFDSVLDGTISDEEFARYVPLRAIFPQKSSIPPGPGDFHDFVPAGPSSG